MRCGSSLSDPDGGAAVRTVTVKTRAEPMPAAGGHIYHVYPRDWKGAERAGLVQRPDVRL